MSKATSVAPPLKLTTGRVIFAIAGVYITQSLISALSMQSLPALVRAAGGSLELTGATTLFMLPWALKFIWAPWVERWRLPPGCSERRSRKIIARGQLMLAVIMLMAAATGWLERDGRLPGSATFGLFLLLLLAGIVATTIDIASDGFCVDQLTGTGYGWGNSVQIGGSYLGMMCGGGLFLLLAAEYGWPGALLLLALLVVVLSLPLYRITEPMRTTRSQHSPSLRFALRRSATRLGLLLVLVLNLGMRFVMPLSSPLLLDHGITLSALGALLSGANIAAGVVGTLAGGLLIKYCQPGWALLLAYGLQGGALLAVVLTLWLAPEAMILTLLQWGVIAQSVTLACALVCLYATLMSLSSPLQAGVDFTLFQCTDAALAMLAGIAGGVIAQHLGYASCLLFAGSFTLVAAFIVFKRLSSGIETTRCSVDSSGHNLELKDENL